jgi:hypothetical protein
METLELADTRFGKQPASMDVSGKPNLNRRGIASRYARRTGWQHSLPWAANYLFLFDFFLLGETRRGILVIKM